MSPTLFAVSLLPTRGYGIGYCFAARLLLLSPIHPRTPCRRRRRCRVAHPSNPSSIARHPTACSRFCFGSAVTEATRLMPFPFATTVSFSFFPGALRKTCTPLESSRRRRRRRRRLRLPSLIPPSLTKCLCLAYGGSFGRRGGLIRNEIACSCLTVHQRQPSPPGLPYLKLLLRLCVFSPSLIRETSSVPRKLTASRPLPPRILSSGRSSGKHHQTHRLQSGTLVFSLLYRKLSGSDTGT